MYMEINGVYRRTHARTNLETLHPKCQMFSFGITHPQSALVSFTSSVASLGGKSAGGGLGVWQMYRHNICKYNSEHAIWKGWVYKDHISVKMAKKT